MTAATGVHGECPVPFLQESKYPYHGGHESARICQPAPSLQGNISCCLPCPLTDWVYPDDFSRFTTASSWLNVVSLVCCVILLLSFCVLQKAKTSRHYLTVCMVIAIGFISLSFLIPLGSKPDQCHDSITPNDMYSDLTCAFSGAFLLVGGFASVMWVFLRSLCLHLQICWEIIPGEKFFYGALLAGWGLPALFVSLALSIAGVSYRFGDTCHINHNGSLGTFWIPILTFAGLATIIQFSTFGYCIRVYIKALLDSDTTTQNSSGLPSIHGSVRTVTAKAAYRRIRKVIGLQWRDIIVVVLIITDVVFFSVIFIYMDNTIMTVLKNHAEFQPWVLCLVISGGDKNQCLPEASSLAIKESTVMAVLVLLSLNGIWALLFLGRWQMAPAWLSILRRPLTRTKFDFASVDARRIADSRNYEMLASPPQVVLSARDKPPHPTVTDMNSLPRTFSPSSQTDYFGGEARYHSPTLSFSSPRHPSRSTSAATRTDWRTRIGKEWDPSSTYAPGNFGPVAGREKPGTM